MAPRNDTSDGQDFLPELEPEIEDEPMQDSKVPETKILWTNIMLMLAFHLSGLYAITLIPYVNLYTNLWSLLMYVVSCFSVTGGVHRLWAHRTYKARLPLRIFYAITNLAAFQNSIFDWARDHRSHHKFSDTNADPHNSKRGVFFSHVGWLLVKKHPDILAKSNACIDISDLLADPVVRIQRKYYKPGVILMCFVLPTLVPWYFWNECIYQAYFMNILRYVAALNATWLVNSAAHKWGKRPYDKSIPSVENLFVSFFAIGEGFHNYHHVFPHDYSTSEHGWYINLTTFLLDCLAKLGYVYDRRKMSKEIILKRKMRTGELS